MNRFKRMAAGVLVATAAISGVGGTANASEAAAFSKRDCVAKHDYWGNPVWSCYYDFNWFEETFQGKVDGRYVYPRAIWA